MELSPVELVILSPHTLERSIHRDVEVVDAIFINCSTGWRQLAYKAQQNAQQRSWICLLVDRLLARCSNEETLQESDHLLVESFNVSPLNRSLE